MILIKLKVVLLDLRFRIRTYQILNGFQIWCSKCDEDEEGSKAWKTLASLGVNICKIAFIINTVLRVKIVNVGF